jgi:hypothetical protein
MRPTRSSPGGWDGTVVVDLVVVIGAAVVALALAAITLRRRTV